MTTKVPNVFGLLSPVRDMDAKGWLAFVSVGRSSDAPVVKLQCLEPFEEKYEYGLATLLDAAACGRGFNFGDAGNDKLWHRLSPVAVAALAAEARSKVPATVGQFEMRWIPNDPTVPF